MIALFLDQFIETASKKNLHAAIDGFQNVQGVMQNFVARWARKVFIHLPIDAAMLQPLRAPPRQDHGSNAHVNTISGLKALSFDLCQ